MNFPLTYFPVIETERLVLRPETPQDAKAVFAVLSDPAVTEFHDLNTFTEIEEALDVIERHAQRFELGRGILWGIARKQDNILIGSCGFSWDKQAHGAEIGYELKSEFWRQGIMSEALQAILNFGFEEVGLQFVMAEVMLSNVASKKLLEKLGFESQGILLQHGFWKGQYHDLEQFLLTNIQCHVSEPIKAAD